MQRKIVEIDESKCNGCGLCVPACAEGAIQIVDGKARLVSEVYCDGLGACLGECPQGAIRIVEREAEAFDESAVHEHLRRASAGKDLPGLHVMPTTGTCPGSAVQTLPVLGASSLPSPASGQTPKDESAPPPSALGNWPLQLHLVPPQAPFLREADLLLVADCVPFALADFHQRFLRRRPVVIGCPKLDDARLYVDKLASIVATAQVRSITVIHMEVPCCTGMVRIAQQALQQAKRHIPLEDVTISIRGRVLPPAAGDP